MTRAPAPPQKKKLGLIARYNLKKKEKKELKKTDFENEFNKITSLQQILGDNDASVSAAVKSTRSAVVTAHQKVDEKYKNEKYSDALKLLTKLDLATLVTDAKNTRDAFDTDKAKYDTDKPAADAQISELCKHPQWKAVDPKINALIDKQDEAEAKAKVFEYAEALVFVGEISTGYVPVKKLADECDKYKKAETLAEGLIKELKDHTQKKITKKPIKALETKLAAAKTKATQEKYLEGLPIFDEITTGYNTAMKSAGLAELKDRVTDKLKELKKHKRISVIQAEFDANELKEKEAEANINDGLHKSADRIIWAIYNDCDRLKKIADASQAYEDARKEAADKIKELEDRKQPKIDVPVAALNKKLGEAAALGANDKQLYYEAQLLLNEIKAECAPVKQLADEYDKFTKEKETALKQDPKQALASLRATLAELEKKAPEVVKAMREDLDNAKKKLDEAEKKLEEQAKQEGAKKTDA